MNLSSPSLRRLNSKPLHLACGTEAASPPWQAETPLAVLKSCRAYYGPLQGLGFDLPSGNRGNGKSTLYNVGKTTP